MANPSVTYTFFVNGQTSDGPNVSQNFTDLINALTDGTKTITVSNVITSTATITNLIISTAISLADGLVGAPAIFFTNAATTGFYRAAGTQIGITSGGTLTTLFTANYSEHYFPIRHEAGTVAAPVGTFRLDTDTGFYNSAANTFDIAVGGVNHLSISLTAGTSIVPAGGKVGFYGVTPAVRSNAYTITAGSTDRTYNPTATTLLEVANVLGTVISDLQLLGLLG